MARCMSQDIQLLVIRQASLILRIVNTAAMSIMCFITATFFWIAVSPTLPESKGILTVDEILVAAVVGFFFFTGLIAMLFAQSLLAFNTTSLNHLVDIVQGDLPEEEQREESPGEVEDGESPSTGSLS